MTRIWKKLKKDGFQILNKVTYFEQYRQSDRYL